ncbi:DNA-binding response regulator, OmpR family, contains REC and winged-helix (wHTH) domain [Chryseolinea serpens]|uniref:DNA-binding response regulator, OmpR family, contains REC and winged-helix (WHTH) domain n=1 Tax=Chryseolinea serpens TaxID=947013 RepID=A0A1M5QKY2_9BACT|nr:response regulator transcription factor [Chryseolinea serpens]SHH14283.1 DNA-binding response regulator, OmpR family, contains REC and winged-helix (wHTH) domain [Chryseolinea serpens]
MKRILLIEDESSVVSFIKKGLTEEGYEVSVALDGHQGMQMALAHEYDLIILDIMLPGKNGLDLCRDIRAQNKKVALLFLTALGTAENIVLGLETGADDYLVKPFKFIELLARIKSLLRRTEPVQTPNVTVPSRFGIADLELDDFTKTVTRAGVVISLTATEYRLLFMFLKNQRRVLSRMEILEQVWGVDFDMGTNVVDVYVNFLRKKLEVNQSSRLLHTVVGMGYVLKEE